MPGDMALERVSYLGLSRNAWRDAFLHQTASDHHFKIQPQLHWMTSDLVAYSSDDFGSLLPAVQPLHSTHQHTEHVLGDKGGISEHSISQENRSFGHCKVP